MEYGDVMQLMALYLGFFTSVFGLPYAAMSLWRWFKEISDPEYKSD